MIDNDGREPATSPKGSTASVQVLAAVLLTVCAVAGVWGTRVFGGSSAPTAKPAPCNTPRADDSPEYPALCAALNRPDLPALLGMPDDHVSIAQSGGGQITFADGTKEFDASAQIQIGAVCVRISHDPHSSVEDLSFFPGLFAERTSVLGRPAATYSAGTVALLAGGAKPGTRPGGLAHHLVVAQDPHAGGDGTYEIAVWRQDDVAPDADVLLRIAEQVLPTVPGWGTAS
ncbi:DUF6215 domain-containing protein [Kitasatospora paranensis]|uniref:DUF6215 domain-containing protein n=1 Tax=Kitasatospora paranensis TaxID=258053 RepID=A0ABW2FV85_9ACTN